MNASEKEPSEPLPNERDSTLLREVVWSVAFIGAVVAYLVLVVQFA